MEKRLLMLTVILVLGYCQVEAQSPKFSNDFLTIGVGARAHGMSNAVVASTNDIYAGFWNPASLSNIEAPLQVGVMHAEWFAGIGKYDYLAFGKSFNSDKKGFGALSVIRMGIDQIPNTLRLRDPDGNINYDAIEEFSVADYAFLLSYAQQIGNKGLRVGGNAKVIHRSVGSFAKAWGFGLDISAEMKSGNFTFAGTLRDVTSTFNAWSFSFTEEEKEVLTQTNNDIPERSIESTLPTASLGVAYKHIFGENFSLLSELDIEASTNGRESGIISSNSFIVDPRFGVEFGYKDYAFLRGGVGNVQKVINDVDGLSTDLIFQPTLGLGLRLGRIHLDYAFTDIGDVSIVESSHIISLTLDFDRRAEAN